MVEPSIKKTRLNVTTKFSISHKNSSSIKNYSSNSIVYNVLLDPGTSASIISYKCVKNNTDVRKKENSTIWGTPAGGIKTDQKVRMKFTLNEFFCNKKINWDFHVAKPYHKLGYDMIMGRDLLYELGIIIDFKNLKLAWDGEEISMPRQEMSCIIPCKTHEEPTSVNYLSSRATRILDARYEAVDVRAIADACTHLDSEEQYALKLVLKNMRGFSTVL